MQAYGILQGRIQGGLLVKPSHRGAHLIQRVHGDAWTSVRFDGLLQTGARPDVDADIGAAREADISRLAERDAHHAVDLGHSAELAASVREATTCDIQQRQASINYTMTKLQDWWSALYIPFD